MPNRHFGIAAETTWSTSVTPTRFFEALSESVQMERAFDTIETVRGFSPQDLVELSAVVRGDVEILANYDGIGILYDQLIGSSDSTTSGSLRQHTFPASTGIPAADRIGKSHTAEFRRDTSLVWTYAGGKVTGLTHVFSTDQASRITLGLLYASEATTSSATTASYSTLLPMNPAHVSTVSLDGGSTTICARNVTITIENPVDELICLGSSTIVNEPDRSGVLKVTGSAEAIFEDFTEYNYFDGTTVVDVQLVSTNTTESITYNFNKTRLLQATPHMIGRDRLSVTYEFESYYDTDATENLQVILLNNDTNP